jgi:hypothetical protein
MLADMFYCLDRPQAQTFALESCVLEDSQLCYSFLSSLSLNLKVAIFFPRLPVLHCATYQATSGALYQSK